MTALFGRHEARRYLGVDIGSQSIKVVELADVNHTPELITYGLAELPPGGFTGSDAVVSGQVASIIEEVCRSARVTATKAMTALPTHAVFTSLLSLPKLSQGEAPAAIRAEVAKVTPLPINDMIIDPQILPAGEHDVGMRVLITGAPKTVVSRYVDIFKQTNLQLLSLETEGFALIRSLIGKDTAATMMIDLGASTTDIVIVDGAVPFLNRSISIGGLAVTGAMAESLRLSLSDAEQVKRDIGLMMNSETNTLPPALTEALAPIINEMKFTLKLYHQETGKGVEKVVLAGGSALLPRLPEYLSGVLNLRVYVGDPWARVRYPLELKSVLAESASRYSVAVGLAMRDIK